MISQGPKGLGVSVVCKQGLCCSWCWQCSISPVPSHRLHSKSYSHCKFLCHVLHWSSFLQNMYAMRPRGTEVKYNMHKRKQNVINITRRWMQLKNKVAQRLRQNKILTNLIPSYWTKNNNNKKKPVLVELLMVKLPPFTHYSSLPQPCRSHLCSCLICRSPPGKTDSHFMLFWV